MNTFDETHDTTFPEGYWLQEVFVQGERRMCYFRHDSKPSLFLIYQISTDREIGEYSWVIDHSPEITVTEINGS